MFGISNSVKSREVRECTPDLFRRVVRSERVARICAEIEDALEKVRRGEMSKEDFEVFQSGVEETTPHLYAPRHLQERTTPERRSHTQRTEHVRHRPH